MNEPLFDDVEDPALVRLEALGIETGAELRQRVATPGRVKLMADYLELERREFLARSGINETKLVIESALATRRAGHKRGAMIPLGSGVHKKAVSPLDGAEQDLLEMRLVMRKNPKAKSPPVVLDHLLTPVRDQANRGTCVAFATVAAYEGFRILGGETKKGMDYSEQFVYCSAKARDGYEDDEGTFVANAFEGLFEDGVCLETTWPYNPDPVLGNEGQGPAKKKAKAEAAKNAIEESAELNPRSPGKIKRAMQADRLVAFSVVTWPFWDEPPYNKTGKLTLPIPGEDRDGAHAVCLYGYRDNPSRPGGGDFLFKNSWGTRWGKDGLGAIPYRYVELYGLEAFVVVK